MHNQTYIQINLTLACYHESLSNPYLVSLHLTSCTPSLFCTVSHYKALPCTIVIVPSLHQQHAYTPSLPSISNLCNVPPLPVVMTHVLPLTSCLQLTSSMAPH